MGRIWAENRPLPPGYVAPPPDEDDEDEPTRHGAGARFTVSLPACAA